METKIIHPYIGEVTLSQTRRASSISLSVRPTGSIRLSYPYFISTKKALAFLESKVEWIEQALAKMPKCSPRSAAEIEGLRKQAKSTLPSMVAEIAEKFGFKYSKLTIRASRSKWGCCTSNNNLSLSLFLVTLPLHLQQFVILHELCHTRHHNHSTEFHDLLNRLTNNKEAELNRELKSYRPI